MQIKRTFAPTMRDALLLVKQEQGADAVILGNKKVSGGVEILSAIDFDEAAVSRMATSSPAPQREPAPVAASDAWIGSMLDDGRKEPVIGPVPGARPKLESELLDNRAPKQASQSRSHVNTRTAATKPRRAQPAAKKAVAGKPMKRKTVVKKNATSDMQAGATVSSPSAMPTPDKPVIDEVRIELQNLRELMESQLSVLQWDRFSRKHPVRTMLLNLMSEMRLGTDVCDTVLSHLDQLDDDPQKVWQQALGIIVRCIPINRRDLLAEGGRIALVGSTGVGKTTTIAKIAARFAHTNGKRSVAMISTDQFRIGAQEQLQHYARLLEVPMLVAGNSEELCDRLSMLADKKLVLIDTAGMSQRDLRLAEQFHHLHSGAPEVRPYLVLSANTQLAALNQTVLNFEKVKLAGAIVTKLDEAASLGGVITTSIRHKLRLAYCGTGQHVPKDLEPAKSHNLVRRAVSLMRQYGEQSGQEALALRYNHIINKNHA